MKELKSGNSIKVSDLIVNFVESLKVKEVFLISGGGNIHIIDSIGKSKKLRYICNHHEQASATAAEAYSRVNGNIGVCIVTTGPGGTNAITGVLGSWLDSIPVLVISGQVKRELIGAKQGGLRQLGDQEINIVDIVKPVVKYTATVNDPEDILFHLEKAVFLAKTGRPGPVWIDVPLDVQGSFVKKSDLTHFDPKREKLPFKTDVLVLKKLVKEALDVLSKSKRPVLYIGNGVKLSHASTELLELIRLLKIPVLTSYAGYDLISSDNPYFFGRGHAFGQRAANFILQNSDFFLSVGARLDIRTIGFTYRAFAREAYKVMVDIDNNELDKFILSPNLKVNFDAKQFINEMIKQIKEMKLNLKIDEWINYGKMLNSKYKVVLPEYWKERKYVNPYCFIDTIGQLMQENEIIVVSDGIGPLNCSYQALYIKKGQKVILNNGCAQMGYGLPAAIGAAFASGKRIICFEGDGSIQLNIHELQVIKHHNLPIKIFIYNNDGYLSIRNTQKNLFNSKFVASNSQSGISCPDFIKIAKAYGIPAIRINNHLDMKRKIIKVLGSTGPIICEINSLRDLMLTPKLASRKNAAGQFESPPLEDMFPFLPRNEFEENMIIPIWKDQT